MDPRKLVMFALGVAVASCICGFEVAAKHRVAIRDAAPTVASRYHQRSRVPNFYRRSRGRVVRRG